MKILFIHPPFSDPTQAYLSLPYLKGYLNKTGYKSKIIDLNIEGFYYLFSDDFHDKITKKITIKFNILNKKKSLNFIEQLEYKTLFESLKIIDNFKERNSLIQVLKNESDFYNYQKYHGTVNKIDKYFDLINSAFFPFKFSFNYLNHFILPWNFELLNDYCNKDCSPFNDFYFNYFKKINFKPDIIGISLTFYSQIAEAFNLTNFLKKLYPECFFIFGGAAIHQIVNNLDDNIIKNIFNYIDGISVFDGEISLPVLIDQLKNKKTALQKIPNFITYDKNKDNLIRGNIISFDLKESVLPDYSDLDLNKYLSCEKILLYAPTRGCYWRKCSFCAYGYSGEFSYRELNNDKAADEIKKLSKIYNVKNFYISCDVLSPVYAIKFAESLIKNNIDINWSCDLKLEKYYNEDNINILKKSGLVSVAFGVESGSDKILKLINKGLNSLSMKKVSRLFHQSGIAVQWMTFTDHPGENYQDALSTINIIQENLDFIDLFIVGEFGLTSGSKIAACPEKYFINKIYYTLGDQLRLFPLYKTKVKNKTTNEKIKIDDYINLLSEKYRLMHYPWAGAISTNHSLLYFKKYGQNIFKDLLKINIKEFKLNLKNIKSSYNMNLIQKNEQIFYTMIYEQALNCSVKKNNSLFAPLSNDYLLKITEYIKKVFKK